MSDLGRVVRVLVEEGVRFILVGGMAGIAHGSARLTEDLDVVYARDPENIKLLATALAPFHPYPRGAPPGLPFLWDAETIRRGLNFTLTTDLGWVDILGEIAGGGSYDQLVSESRPLRLFGIDCLCLNLDSLIRTKRAAGRPKDFEAIAELEALWEERAELERIREELESTD
jgi:predicted nucleotidyltransferase